MEPVDAVKPTCCKKKNDKKIIYVEPVDAVKTNCYRKKIM
jgi:hypothetical protein